MDNGASTIGNRIYTRRKQLHYTMEELGKKVGVTKSTVNKWEKGMITNFNRSTLGKIALSLECTIPYLLGETDDVQGIKRNGESSLAAIEKQWVERDQTISNEIATEISTLNVLDKEVIYIVVQLLENEIGFDEMIKYYAQLDNDRKYYANDFIELLFLNNDDENVLKYIKNILRYMTIDSLRDLNTYSQAIIDMKTDFLKNTPGQVTSKLN